MAVVPKCAAELEVGRCSADKSKALNLKIIAIVLILVTSMVGVSLPLITRSIPALSPEKNLFSIVKAFSAGIIHGTGFMHVLPDSFEMLSSCCLPDFPWHDYPFSGFVSMLSAIVTMMSCTNKDEDSAGPINADGDEEKAVQGKEEAGRLSVSRFRVIAMVLELGIIVHSIVIGLSMGASLTIHAQLKALWLRYAFIKCLKVWGLVGAFFKLITPLSRNQ